MPLYLFSNPKDESEIVEVVMSVHDKHELIKDGIKWDRVFTKINASVDSKLDPNSAKDFVKYTAAHRGTVGDIMDLSAELSQKRAGMTGQDHLKEKTFNEYSKKRRGMLHPQQKKEKARKELKKFGITVTD